QGVDGLGGASEQRSVHGNQVSAGFTAVLLKLFAGPRDSLGQVVHYPGNLARVNFLHVSAAPVEIKNNVREWKQRRNPGLCPRLVLQLPEIATNVVQKASPFRARVFAELCGIEVLHSGQPVFSKPSEPRDTIRRDRYVVVAGQISAVRLI